MTQKLHDSKSYDSKETPMHLPNLHILNFNSCIRAAAKRGSLRRTVCAVFVALCVLHTRLAGAQFTFRETSPATLELAEHGKPVFVYNFGGILPSGFPEKMRRESYIHPVYAPDGTLLSDDFNPNHPHHRGIFWAWEEVTTRGKKDDSWTVKGYRDRFVRWITRDTQGRVAKLAVENGWYDGDRKFAKEEVEILTYLAEHNRRLMEFTLRFEALDAPVTLEGTHVEKKGYGGFAFRFQTPDGGGKQTVIRTEQGLAAKDGVMARHVWAEISGIYKGKVAGARIEDDTANPGYPQNGWLLRHELCLLNPSYPGNDAVILQPGRPLILKYRVTLFTGDSPPVETAR